MIAEHTTRIEAPPAEVWRVPLDIDRWPEWAPTVTAAQRLDDGPFRVGTQVRINRFASNSPLSPRRRGR